MLMNAFGSALHSITSIFSPLNSLTMLCIRTPRMPTQAPTGSMPCCRAATATFAREPASLLEGTPERALVQPDNVEILLDHLACAAFELPFDADEGFGAVVAKDARVALDCLVEEGRLSRSGGRFHYVHETYPAGEISLRDIGGEHIVAVDGKTGDPLAEVDLTAARRELHERAVYQHEGQTYEVVPAELIVKAAITAAANPATFVGGHKCSGCPSKSTCPSASRWAWSLA